MGSRCEIPGRGPGAGCVCARASPCTCKREGHRSRGACGWLDPSCSACCSRGEPWRPCGPSVCARARVCWVAQARVCTLGCGKQCEGRGGRGLSSRPVASAQRPLPSARLPSPGELAAPPSPTPVPLPPHPAPPRTRGHGLFPLLRAPWQAASCSLAQPWGAGGGGENGLWTDGWRMDGGRPARCLKHPPPRQELSPTFPGSPCDEGSVAKGPPEGWGSVGPSEHRAGVERGR